MGLIEDGPDRFFKKEVASLQRSRKSLPICKIVTIFQRKIGTNRKVLHKHYYLQVKKPNSHYGIDDVYPWFTADGFLVCAISLRGSIYIESKPGFSSSGTITNFTSSVN